jgi:hypothetical protein
MKSVLWALMLTVGVVSCGPQKKQGDETGTTVQQPARTDSPAVVADAGSLDELVYEGVGASLLKKESLARSQAEQKGRVAIMKVLGEDAAALIRLFAQRHAEVLTEGADVETFARSAEAALNQSTTLRGSRVSEYTQSANKDTTFAILEMPLMSGYDAIEQALADVGQKGKYLKSGDEFRKMFREFFLAEKKKLLTVPS